MKWFLQWVSEQGVRPEYSLGKVKYIKLVNQLSLFVGLVSLTYLFFPYPQESLLLTVVKSGVPLLLLVGVPLLNRLNHPKLAKIMLYVVLNANFFISCLLLGPFSGEHLFFIPVIFGSALVFDMRRLEQRLWVLVVPLVALLSLWLFDGSFAPDPVENGQALRNTYGFNYMVTILSSFYLAYLYFRITHEQQAKLSSAIRQLEDMNVTLTEKERSLQHNLQYSDLLLDNLKASKDYFKSVIQNATDIICITGNKGMIKYLTPSFYRLTGYDPEDLRNKTIFDCIHPDDVAECQQRFFNRSFKKKGQQPFMFRYQKANGEYLYLEANGTNLLHNKAVNGVVINARDISDRIGYEQEIIRKEKNIRSILDNSPASIWLVDKDYRLLDFNTTFSASLKKSQNIKLKRGVDMMKIFPEPIAALWRERYEAAREGRQEEYMETLMLDGQERTYLVQVYPIMKDGIADRYTVFAKDITLQRQAELALIEAKEKAEEATQVKAQFLSTMSHEIRTPMNAIIGLSHVLELDNPRPDQAENVRLLKFSAENLLALINDILDYNKIEAGKVVFEKSTFDLRQLVNDLKSSLRIGAKEKDLQLEVLHDVDLPNAVVGDSVRLSQVLINLMSNAIKFTEKGYVRIQTQLLAEVENSYTIAFSVEDTGIGIAPEKLGLIFESFTQAEADTTRRYGGTGLGLSISKRLLELQDSSIKVESQPGKGSVFSFVLSFEKPLEKTDAMHTVNFESRESFSELKVLLVEDNPLNRFVAEKFLSRWEMEMDVAENGEAALQLLEKNQYSLVLMDLQLPDIDGFEVIEQLRAGKSPNCETPVIAMSASTEPHVQAKAYSAGMQDYVTKPFDPEELKQKIYSLLGNNSLARVGS